MRRPGSDIVFNLITSSPVAESGLVFNLPYAVVPHLACPRRLWHSKYRMFGTRLCSVPSSPRWAVQLLGKMIPPGARYSRSNTALLPQRPRPYISSSLPPLSTEFALRVPRSLRYCLSSDLRPSPLTFAFTAAVCRRLCPSYMLTLLKRLSFST